MNIFLIILIVFLSACTSNPVEESPHLETIDGDIRAVISGEDLSIYLQEPGNLIRPAWDRETHLKYNLCVQRINGGFFGQHAAMGIPSWCIRSVSVQLPKTDRQIIIRGYSTGPAHQVFMSLSKEDTEVHQGTMDDPLNIIHNGYCGFTLHGSPGEEIVIDSAVRDSNDTSRVAVRHLNVSIGTWEYKLSTESNVWGAWARFTPYVRIPMPPLSNVVSVLYRDELGQVFGPYSSVFRY